MTLNRRIQFSPTSPILVGCFSLLTSSCFAQGMIEPVGRTSDRVQSKKILGYLPDPIHEFTLGDPPLPAILPPPFGGPGGGEFEGRDTFSLTPSLLDDAEFTAAPFILADPAAPVGTIPTPASGTMLLLSVALWAPRRRSHCG